MREQKHLHHRTRREYVESACFIGSSLVFVIIGRQRNKKAGAVEHLEVFDRAGLLVNEPPGKARLPFT